MERPLPESQAKKLIGKLAREGKLVLTGHAKREMAKDRMIMSDVLNVLRCGQITEPAEFENHAWRYRVHTARFCVVCEFDALTELIIVTAWRKK